MLIILYNLSNREFNNERNLKLVAGNFVQAEWDESVQ